MYRSCGCGHRERIETIGDVEPCKQCGTTAFKIVGEAKVVRNAPMASAVGPCENGLRVEVGGRKLSARLFVGSYLREGDYIEDGYRFSHMVIEHPEMSPGGAAIGRYSMVMEDIRGGLDVMGSVRVPLNDEVATKIALGKLGPDLAIRYHAETLLRETEEKKAKRDAEEAERCAAKERAAEWAREIGSRCKGDGRGVNGEWNTKIDGRRVYLVGEPHRDYEVAAVARSWAWICPVEDEDLAVAAKQVCDVLIDLVGQSKGEQVKGAGVERLIRSLVCQSSVEVRCVILDDLRLSEHKDAKDWTMSERARRCNAVL